MSLPETLAAANTAVPTGIPTGAPVAATIEQAQTHAQTAMQLDITTVLAIAAFIVSMGTILWKMSADATQRKAFETYTTARDVERNKYREDFEKAVEARFAAVQATNTLCQTQIAELRERLVGQYMTKPEIAEIERRVQNGQERMNATLEKIDGRLHDLSGKVMEALQHSSAKNHG